MAELNNNGVTNLEYQVKPQQSFINRAVAIHFTSGSNEEVKGKLPAQYPSYEEYDATLETPYDSKFKEYHTDRPVESIGKSCLHRTVAVVQDRPMEICPVPCCIMPCMPPEEKVFVRVVKPYTPTDLVECDGRVPTITTNHYAFKEEDKKSDEYYGQDNPMPEQRLVQDPRDLEGVTNGSEVKGITITPDLVQTVAEQRKKASKKKKEMEAGETTETETTVVPSDTSTETNSEHNGTENPTSSSN